jgi:uncharacterized membrane protein
MCQVMLAEIGSTSYDIVLMLHIISAIVAFAPAFVHPLLASQTKQLDAADRSRLAGYMAVNGRRVYAPALIVTGLLGLALQGMSDSVWKFSQVWIWLAVVIWLAMNGVLHAVLLPAERAVADGDQAAARRVDAAGGLLTLALVVMIYLMVFKPGF